MEIELVVWSEECKSDFPLATKITIVDRYLIDMVDRAPTGWHETKLFILRSSLARDLDSDWIMELQYDFITSIGQAWYCVKS